MVLRGENDHVINEIIVEKLISIILLSLSVFSLAVCFARLRARKMQKTRCRYKNGNVNGKNEKFFEREKNSIYRHQFRW